MKHAAFAIGMVTPYSWSRPSGVNRHIAAVADRLTARGHRVIIIAPSADRHVVRQTRQLVRELLMDERSSVFDPDEPYPRHFFAGGTYAVRRNRATTLIAASADLLGNVDVLLRSEQLDVLHVHEPFVPGVGWTSLRHAGCPLVATFHIDSEQSRTYWLARRARLQRYFEAFDSVLAVSRSVRDSVWRAFEGEVDIVPDCVDTALFTAARRAALAGPGTAAAGGGEGSHDLGLVFAGTAAPRAGMRHLLRALRRLEPEVPRLRVDVAGARLEERYAHLVPEAFAGRVRFHDAATDAELARIMAGADVLCAPAPEAEEFDVGVVQGMAAGLAAVVSDVAGHRELIDDGVDGLLVPPRQSRTLAWVLRDLMADAPRRAALGAAAQQAAERFDVDVVAGQLEEVYAAAAERRAPARAAHRLPPAPAVEVAAASGSLRALALNETDRRAATPVLELYADFHMHSEHSKDCVVPVRDLLVRARECGLDVIAITDHDSADGGLEGRELADEHGVRVIVGEEVKTAEGEVVGLFLERTIPGGMSFAETVAAIKEQEGIVYLPHPFDRLHTVPSYAILKQHVRDIDVVEVFNSRLAFPAFNERAELFAERYRILEAAGSDAHVLAGLGTAMTAMGSFDGRHDFLDALAESRIIRRPKSYLYLTGLKFIQTSFDGGARQRDTTASSGERGSGRRRSLRGAGSSGGRRGVPPGAEK
jgi:predicted metal-dependent phosphoesterase TrpH/glycosyltransferase involved in cell wall biosynthesis